MATTLALRKVSGVISASVDGATLRYFFGATGNYQADTAGTNVLVTIGPNQGLSPALQVNVPYGGVSVNGQTASSMSTALVLLNALFGT